MTRPRHSDDPPPSLPWTIRPSGAAYRTFQCFVGGAIGVLVAVFVFGAKHPPAWAVLLVAALVGFLFWSLAEVVLARVDIDDAGLTLRGPLRKRTARFSDMRGVAMHTVNGYRDTKHFLRIALAGGKMPPIDIRADFLEFHDTKRLRALLTDRIEHRSGSQTV